jgi:hypothetical protein
LLIPWVAHSICDSCDWEMGSGVKSLIDLLLAMASSSDTLPFWNGGGR